MSDYSAIGRGIKLVRAHLGCTQKELASQIGVTESTIAAIENGRRFVSKQLLESVARAFAVPESFFSVLGQDLPRDAEMARLVQRFQRSIRELLDTRALEFASVEAQQHA